MEFSCSRALAAAPQLENIYLTKPVNFAFTLLQNPLCVGYSIKRTANDICSLVIYNDGLSGNSSML